MTSPSYRSSADSSVSTSIVRPPRLEPGDHVGIAAPSGPVDRNRLMAGIRILEGFQLRPVFSESLFQQNTYLAGTDRERAETLNLYFKNPDIRAIICARGGYGAMRMLPYLDFERIRQNPRILVGFSDVTALLAAVYRRCDLVVFHGPMIASLPEISKTSRQSFIQALTSDVPMTVRFSSAKVLHPGNAFGPLFAGNLTTLSHLLKTPYEPCLDGHILAIEDIHEALYRIDRMITQMIMAGYLDNIRGLILGRFDHCGDNHALHRFFLEAFRDRNIPILAECGIGHGQENVTIPIGVTAVLSTDDRSLTLDISATLPGKTSAHEL